MANEQFEKNQAYIDKLMKELRPPKISPPDPHPQKVASVDTDGIEKPLTQQPLLLGRRPDESGVSGSGVLHNIIIVFAGTAFYSDIPGKVTGPV